MSQTLLAPATAPVHTSPYRALEPYTEADWPIFFGRDRECEIIVANLTAARLTLFYGASGVGKTSVLRAGVAYQLAEVARQNRLEVGTPEHAVVVFSAWRDDPIAALLASVATAVADALGDQSALSVPAAPSDSLAESLGAWAALLGGQLLIVLDQFEEYFLYHGHEDGPGTFAVEFPRAVNRVGLPVNFLVGIREDALARLDRFKGRIPDLFANYLRLDYLGREEARAAIEAPIEHVNRLRAGTGLPISVEPELITAVLDQVAAGGDSGGEAGQGVIQAAGAPERIDTSYLQVVMTRLWNEERRVDSHTLRLETLQRLGSARDILRTHLDDTMDALPSEEQATAAEVFHFLVTPSGAKIAHTASDLASYTGLDHGSIGVVLRRLSQQVRILRSVAPPGQLEEPRYEIYHDRLADAILSWRARYRSERQVAAERARARVQLEAAQAEAEQRIAQQQAQADARLDQEVTLVTARTRRRILLPVAWALLFWITFAVAEMAWITFAVAEMAWSAVMGAVAPAMAGSLFSVLTDALLAGLAVGLAARQQARALRARQVWRIAGWWMLGGLCGVLGGFALNDVLSRLVDWGAGPSSGTATTAPDSAGIAQTLLLVAPIVSVVGGFVTQTYLAGRLTLREVDRAGGFDTDRPKQLAA